jgi:serine/threonine protein kinase
MHTAEIEAGALVDGRYLLIEPLGTGGMSRVFLARDRQLDREVALKLFRAVDGDESDAARRRDEAHLLARLAHPGLVVVYDAAIDADPPYLSMERVVGETLQQRLRRGALDPEEAAAVLGEVARALAYVHEHGIVHRDLKPANILLPPADAPVRAKLADFGIARLLDGDRMTATGTVMGTAAYISPEQASGAPVTPASDVYALGLVLLEALTGERPFPGTAIEALAARLARDPDLSAPEAAPYRPLLARMTARDPAQRPSAADVAAALGSGTGPTAVLETVPLAPETVPLPSETDALADQPVFVAQPTARTTAGRAVLVAACGLLIAALFGVATLALMPQDGITPPVMKVMPTAPQETDEDTPTTTVSDPGPGGGPQKGPKDGPKDGPPKPKDDPKGPKDHPTGPKGPGPGK